MKKLISILFLPLLFFSITFVACGEPRDNRVKVSQNYSIRYSVFFPATYQETEKDFPTIFMLHGLGGDFRQWQTIADLQKFADKYQFIIFTVDGFIDSWYLNSKFDKEMQYETMFIERFLPKIFARYRINEGKLGITGLSMGGHGAIKFVLKYPEIFSAGASTSGILDITKFDDRSTIAQHLGEFNSYPENWKANSCYYLLDKLTNKNVKLFVDSGVDDYAYDVTRAFKEKADSLGISCEFLEMEGGHFHEYWSRAVVHHFNFFDRVLNNK
ncbi:MAG: hypothetical protein C0425_04460 [Chlorobiaceae bacterium]|nr:hypothetical protein [Chlorobiaceae bacterium]MBA4309568.1 hypothetical protein [Chlorobiaceae bacterium]